MTDIAQRPDADDGGGPDADDPTGRLAAFEARTQVPLDLLALVTLWLTVVPPWDFGHDVVVYAARICLSVVYAVDLGIRSALARRHVHYALVHPVALASVVFPPVRVFFSLRLARSMFRRGHLERFLATALLLVFNGAAIAYLYERHAPGSNIHTLGESVWWSLVTVTTVGYGDYTPVTVPGRITACGIMGIGLVTLAVITAQVASSFLAQGAGRAQRGPRPESAQPEVTLAELDRRLARIEELLTASAPSSQRATGAPDRGPGTM
jgi:voltage-gated potassium channel